MRFSTYLLNWNFSDKLACNLKEHQSMVDQTKLQNLFNGKGFYDFCVD